MSAKTQRERKMRISDGLTLAMGRIGWITLLVILGIGLPVYGLWLVRHIRLCRHAWFAGTVGGACAVL
jgi:hypothetical protein